MSKFSIEYLHNNPKEAHAPWEKVYTVNHEECGILFSITTSCGRSCAYNMMHGVSSLLWRGDWVKTNLHRELKEFLQVFRQQRGRSAWDNVIPQMNQRPFFQVNQLFWTQNTKWDGKLQPEFVKMFEWQSASEPHHKTGMYMYSFGD